MSVYYCPDCSDQIADVDTRMVETISEVLGVAVDCPHCSWAGVIYNDPELRNERLEKPADGGDST